MVKHLKHRNTKKRGKNKRIRKTYRRKYEMKPIYGGNIYSGNDERYGLVGTGKYIANSIANSIDKNVGKPIKSAFDKTAQRLDTENALNPTFLEKQYNRVNNGNLSDLPKAGLVGAVRNSIDVGKKLLGKQVDPRPNAPANIVDVSKSVGNMVNAVSNGVSSVKNSMTNTFNIITEEEKQNIKEKLKLLKDQQQITPTEYEHAVKQLDKKDGIIGMGNSIVSIMSPIQSMVKVIGDWFIRPPDIDEINGRQTVVKLLKFPSSSKSFVKEHLGDNGKVIAELDEYMVVVYDAHDNYSNKLSSDLIGVDNLLANIINGCVGHGCKDGSVHQLAGLNPSIEIVDNKEKKARIEEIERNRLKEIEEDSKIITKGRLKTQ